MTAADLIETYGDELLPHLDNGGTHKPAASLLCQLLLKGSSNDKRFVIEEVQRTLGIAAERISPLPFLDLLLPYASHKSPKVQPPSNTFLSQYLQSQRCLSALEGLLWTSHRH